MNCTGASDVHNDATICKRCKDIFMIRIASKIAYDITAVQSGLKAITHADYLLSGRINLLLMSFSLILLKKIQRYRAGKEDANIF